MLLKIKNVVKNFDLKKTIYQIVLFMISSIVFWGCYGITYLFFKKLTLIGLVFSYVASTIIWLHLVFDDEKVKE